MATASDVTVLSTQEQAALHTVTEGTNNFAIRLYKELTKGKTGNLFVSPLSVQMVLALAYTGAKGNTGSELATLLSLPEQLEDTYSGYHSLVKSLQDPVLKLANRMFVESTAGVKKDFQNNAEKYFLAPAEPVNFKGDPDKSRNHINSWVEEKTNKKITNLLGEGTITGDTRLVLVNAIHFKANWTKKFKESDTKEELFYISKTQTVPVKMMNIKKKFGFKHSQALKAKILELPYEGMNFRMMIVLPDELDGLAELESQLDSKLFFEELKYLEEPTVTVSLPRFRLEETMELNEILKAMGASTMFSNKANFGGLSEEQLVVSKVVQKAFVEVNEQGTEAAAATVASIRLKRSLVMEEEPQEFVADHPFLFIIFHSSSKSVVFAGRISEFRAENNMDRNHDEL